MAERLREWVDDVDLIVTSPYVRARQTADILSEVFTLKKVVEAPELVPQSPPQAFVRWLQAHGRTLNRVMVVGHDPHICTFLSYLIAGVPFAIVEMKKSAVACLEVDSFHDLAPSSAQLNWLVQPRLVVE